MPLTAWTIGHSTRSIEEFLGLLKQYEIEALADVRRFPASRRHPQFNEAALRDSLAEHGMDYVWLPKLGGRRRPAPDSPNTAWRNASFRGYADFLSTAEFAEGFAELTALAERRRTAIMCAEAVWWRCHRALISDVLLSRGWEVIHILDGKKTAKHAYSSAATMVEGRLSYIGQPEARGLFDDLS